jgi:hypothetical protein
MADQERIKTLKAAAFDEIAQVEMHQQRLRQIQAALAEEIQKGDGPAPSIPQVVS